ncbi:hypothetical protein [Sulfitobacter aestuariivivens]|nr:hypothetical protein [Sulfitobacter aestuariivivens]
MTGAVARGFLVALLLATPALMLPEVATDSSQITILIAMLAAFLTTVEYNSNFPSIVSFRDAAPFNRLRFAALLVMVVALSAIIREQTHAGLMTGGVTAIGTILGNALDFPYSPIRLLVLTLPADADPMVVQTVRIAAGLCSVVAMIAIGSFIILVRRLQWPTRYGAFNVWVNLPLFDPTAGGDVVDRLRRQSRSSVVIGFLIPFLIPAVAKLANDLIDPITLHNPQTLIWTICAWAFLPTTLIMRGLAMGKVADLIANKRRRTYADAEAANGYQTA